MALVKQDSLEEAFNMPSTYGTAYQEVGGLAAVSSRDATLLGLPVELQKTILEHLTSSVDKKNLCLACKKLQALVTPLLYKHMDIAAERLDLIMLSTLEAEHPGLPYVQTLCVGSKQHDYNYPDATQTRTLCRLLSTIPQDSLRRFEYSGRLLLDENVHFALRFRQSKVKNYQCYDVHCWEWSPRLDWNNLAPTPDELAHITSLQIHTSGMIEGPEQVPWVYARTPALRNLDLRLETCDLDGDVDCCEHGIFLLEQMFASDTISRPPPKLKTLRIDTMCLMLASDLLPKIFSLEELEHLQLIGCSDVHPFLRKLVPLRLKLSSFCIEGFHRENSDIFAVSDFIYSLEPPSLKRVILKFSDASFFDQRSLKQHASSLECFRIEDKNAEKRPEVPAFQQNSKLEQLALSGIRIDDDDWPDSCLSMCEMGQYLPAQDMVERLKMLRVLKLSVFTYSLSETDTPTQSLCMLRILRTVKPVAEEIFGWKLPKLTAVVLVVEGPRTSLLKESRFAFLRSKSVDSSGKDRYVAVAVEPHMVKHHVPCADILEDEKFVFA